MTRYLCILLAALFIGCVPTTPVDPVDVTDPIPEPEPDPMPWVTWEECGGNTGDHACNVMLQDQNGDEFNLYEQFGSIIVLDFSTMWCGPCNSAGMHSQDVQDQYRDQGVLYVTVLIENGQGIPPALADIQTWVDTFDVTDSPVLVGDRTLLQSSGGPWPLQSWPTFYYIDREMVIQDIDRGYNGEEVIYSIEWMLTL
jgi:thiol-disulfide isomerase/thioredoxin